MADDPATRLQQQAFTLARVTELSVMLGVDADGTPDEAHLRIEVLESQAEPGHFRARIYRLGFFRVRPSFPQHEGEPRDQSDERVWTEFDGFNCPLVSARAFADASAATDYVLRALARWMDASE
jgi:hypothetical protein